MIEKTIMYMLTTHFWCAVGLALVILIILLVPYDIVTAIRSSHYDYIRALLWTWESTPNYTRLRMLGILRLQRMLLRGLHWLWGQFKDRILLGITDMLRRWLE